MHVSPFLLCLHVGGVFWCGSQEDGSVYVYDVPLTSPNSTVARFITSYTPLPGITGNAALNYNPADKLVYGVVKSIWLFSMNSTTGNVIQTWPLGFANAEGVTVLGGEAEKTIYIACDACNSVWKFQFSDAKGVVTGRCSGTFTKPAATVV